MNEIEKLRNIVVMLGNQVALSRYQIAILEGETEAYAFTQLQTALLSMLAMLEEVDLEDITQEDLQSIEESAVSLVRSLSLGRSFN